MTDTINIVSTTGMRIRVIDPKTGRGHDIAARGVTRGVDAVAFRGWCAAYPTHGALPLMREISDEEAARLEEGRAA